MSDLPKPRRIVTCPICDEDMAVERREGVTADVCPAHGVWFDVGELEILLGKVRHRLRWRHRRRLARARQSGKVAGARWGWWSLLAD